MSIRQVGAVSDFTVIEAVGRTLVELLKTEMENPVPVTIASPGEDYGVPIGEHGEELGQSRINLFLYRVEESSFSKNNDWVDSGDGQQMPYPLTLNLHYMTNIFTPDKSSNLDEHRILGDVMRVFHANPVIDPIYFEGTLNPNEPPMGLPWEDLRIIHHALPLEELAAVWHAINKPYRLSVAYEVSVALISPPAYKSRRVRRVETTHVKAEPFRGRPAIDSIVPARGYSGDAVTITGEGFDSPYLKVFFDEAQIEVQTKTSSEVTINLAGVLSPGFYSVRVCNEEGCSERVRFEEISPFLYRLAPDALYVEDTDFPRDDADSPLLTLWGGNFLTDPPTSIEVLASHEGSAEQIFPILSGVSRTSLAWPIPAAMTKGKTTLRIRQNAVRLSNSLTLEVPVPRMYRVDPDVITTLPATLSIQGDAFREGHTKVYLHPGVYASPSDLDPSEVVPATIKNDMEIALALNPGLADGKYQIVIEVYGSYTSAACEISIRTEV